MPAFIGKAMIFRETSLAGAYLIDIEKQADERGFFARTWCSKEFSHHNLTADFVQRSISFNPTPGTLRGLHYQRRPHSETKLVQCLRGAIYDVIVDLRPGSQTFRQWLGVELTVESCRMLYIPEQFAHGFQTLAKDTVVDYMISTFYAPDAGDGVRYDDPSLGIKWPMPVTRISSKDRSWPILERQREF